MTARKLLSRRFLGEAGTGAGTIIVWVGAFSIGTWIFFGVVDWIVGVKHDREAQRQAQIDSEKPRGPHVPRELPGSQLSY